MPCTVWQSEGLWPDNRKRAISKEGLDYAGTVCKQPLLGWQVVLENLSPSPRGPHSFPGFESLGGHFFARRPRLKKVQFEQKKAVSNIFYGAPGPGYGVFVRVHIGYQTRIKFLLGSEPI